MSETVRYVDFEVEDPAPIPFQIEEDGDGIGLEIGDDDDAIELKSGEAVITSDVYPDYTGPYLFTPSPETQVADTRLRSVLDRIVINPIPQNYGLITYNGRTITVS